uniref:RING-type E3 ubiquitin transferase n=1 Tax=Hirondellea gigas TaxID=1518452 RepID=A0A6A7G5N7_9CRUS
MEWSRGFCNRFLLLLLLVLVVADARTDINGVYHGLFFSSEDEYNQKLPERGTILFPVNQTSHELADSIEVEFSLFENDKLVQFRAYGWFTSNTLRLYSNRTAALHHAPVGFHPSNSTFSIPEDDSDSKVILTCNLYLSLHVESDLVSTSMSASRLYQNAKSSKDIYDITISGIVAQFDDCQDHDMNIFVSATKFSEQKFLTKARRYAYAMILVNLVQIYFLLRQLRYSSSSARAQKLSMLTFGILGFFDSFLIVLHSYYGVRSEELFGTFMILSMTQFIIFSVLEMRFMLLITKARNPDQFQGDWDAVRRELGSLYLKFYFLLFLGFVALYIGEVRFVVPIFYSFWIPQIVHNVSADVTRGFTTEFIIVSTIVKMVFPGYFYGCPKQILSAPLKPTNWAFLSGLYIYLWAQTLILLAMNRFGPRFFIPLRWQPERYQYHRFALEDPEDPAPECAICFSPLRDDDPQNDVMVTPCEHAFHDDCLTRWMEQQMKCPTCRGDLPPP